MQRMRLPAHIYYQGMAFKIKVHSKKAMELTKLARRLTSQVMDKLSTVHNVNEKPGSLSAVRLICTRFSLVARQLERRHQSRETLRIQDEYDVQDLLHTLLRLHFDDVRPEEWTPSFAGAASRMDFFLKKEQVVVECKMARKGLVDKEVGEQLTFDIARYKAHPDCNVLVCLVYDPSHLIKNPIGLQNDLGSLSTGELKVEVIIVS